MKNKKVRWIIIGIMSQPLTMFAFYFIWKSLGFTISSEIIKLMFVLSFAMPLAILLSNINEPDAEEHERQRRFTQNNSNIPKEMLKQKPGKGDFILGTHAGKYICTSLKETDSHYAIVGTSGLGKTSAFLLNNLLLNYDTACFVIDVKDSELYRKSAKAGDENVLRFAPSEKFGVCGFDPFYRLNNDSTTQDILDTMQLVCNSLIPIPSDIKDPFWKNNAKNMFLGLSIRFYKDGCHDLISITDKILSQPIGDSITYVLEKSSPTDIEYRYCIMFQSMEDVTLYGIYAELSSSLTVFSNNDGIRRAFGNNSSRKITPLDLEEKKRIYICIDQTQITTLNGVIRMILDVMLYGLQTRMRLYENEADAPPVLFIVDELPQVISGGPLSQLIQGLRVLRSSKVRMVLAFQTRESLEAAYTPAQTTDLISNCNHLIVLNGGNSTSTLKMVCELVGHYSEKERSFQGLGTKHRSTTVNFQDRDILKPSDINRLPLEEKALVLSPNGWMIIKKSPYYKCKYIKPLADEVQRFNQNIKEVEHPIYEAEIAKNNTKQEIQKQLDLWLQYKHKKE